MTMRTVSDSLEGKLKPGDSQPKCPECNSVKIVNDYERGESFCDGCGVVVSEKAIDYGEPYRAFLDSDGSKPRVHHGAPANPFMHDKGLQTTIGKWNEMKDSYGSRVPARTQGDIWRMRRAQSRGKVLHGERSLANGIGMLLQYSSAKGLPKNIQLSAVMLFRRMHQQNLRGRSLEAVTLACLYAACRENGVPRSLDEMAYGANVSRDSIGRTYVAIKKKLHLAMLPPAPEAYIARYAGELHLSLKLQSKVRDILKQYSDNGGARHGSPVALLSGAIFIASVLTGERCIQREIADKLQITEVSIRNNYKTICRVTGIKLNIKR